MPHQTAPSSIRMAATHRLQAVVQPQPWEVESRGCAPFVIPVNDIEDFEGSMVSPPLPPAASLGVFGRRGLQRTCRT